MGNRGWWSLAELGGSSLPVASKYQWHWAHWPNVDSSPGSTPWWADEMEHNLVLPLGGGWRKGAEGPAISLGGT